MPKFEVSYEGPDGEIILQTIKTDAKSTRQVFIKACDKLDIDPIDTLHSMAMLSCGFCTEVFIKEIAS